MLVFASFHPKHSPVIKVEPISKKNGMNSDGDYVRFIEPMVHFNDGISHGVLFEALNGHKRGTAIDLKCTKGVEVLKRLVRELPVDVIVEGNRPGSISTDNALSIPCPLNDFIVQE